jgi:hypothetical protein
MMTVISLVFLVVWAAALWRIEQHERRRRTAFDQLVQSICNVLDQVRR